MSVRLFCIAGVLGSLLGSGLWTGCAGGPQPKSTNFMISSAKAEFYKYGPAQAFGPDQALPRGERVTLLQRQFGFSHVMLADGTSGYVATEDLTPAPAPPPTPKPSLAFTGGRGSSARRTSGPVLPTRDPLFDLNDTPLPQEPEKPPMKFRY